MTRICFTCKEIYEEESDDDVVAQIFFNHDGDICGYESVELPLEDEKKVSLGNKRFENRFIPLQNPFKEGDDVQLTYAPEDGEWIVAVPDDYWDGLLKNPEKAYYDDTFLTIMRRNAYENDDFEHDHVSLLYLEKWQPKAE